MDKLTFAVNEIRGRGINVTNVESIREGENSNCYKISSKECTSLLKFYKADNRGRWERERNFLYFLKTGNISFNCPELIIECEQEKWLLISWLEGNKVKKLKEIHVQQIIEFLCEINELCVGVNRLAYADEAMLSWDIFEKNIILRRKSLDSIIEETKDEKTKAWIKGNIQEVFDKRIKRFQEHKARRVVDLGRVRLIASPSDMGVHNMNISSGKPQFFDFEYAGLDSCIKLSNDIALQPNSPFNNELENYMLELIDKTNLKPSCGWIDDYYVMKELNHSKWCLIILQRYIKEKTKRFTLDKIMNYSKLV